MIGITERLHRNTGSPLLRHRNHAGRYACWRVDTAVDLPRYSGRLMQLSAIS